MTTREEAASRSHVAEVSTSSRLRAYRNMRAVLSAIADQAGIVLNAGQRRRILDDALKRLDRREICTIASSSTIGATMAATVLDRSLSVYTVALALGHILAPETLGVHPQEALMRRAEILLDDIE